MAEWALENILDFQRLGDLALGKTDGFLPADIISAAERVGIRGILGHGSAVMCIRLAMLLLPSIPTGSSFNVQELVVARYLESLGITANEGLIVKVVEIANRIERILDGHVKKKGWADLHYQYQAQLLEAQRFRCRVCGVVLDVAGSSESLRRPELDHILPFVIGGNAPENLRVLCKHCNGAKQDHFTLAQSDYVALNYFIKDRRRAPWELRFWVLVRDESTCTEPGCTASALDDELWVVQRNARGRFVFDNLRTVCNCCRAKVPTAQHLRNKSAKPLALG